MSHLVAWLMQVSGKTNIWSTLKLRLPYMWLSAKEDIFSDCVDGEGMILLVVIVRSDMYMEDKSPCPQAPGIVLVNPGKHR
ncbi:hypothetical protein F2Q70_00023256 [Brassica cretica]|nr:hypothetical protein F2Q70_00023256 [Brassica cretica]KAF3586203.1 hypothetical protein F2Q69_00031379 [Brassica cretica]KAF3611064.1 hypothetical protein DY000_02050311 [Brassica cretica]